MPDAITREVTCPLKHAMEGHRRGLAGAADPKPAEPIFRAGAYLDAARLLAAADGATLNALKLAALALKRGDEAEARRLLAPGERTAAPVGREPGP